MNFLMGMLCGAAVVLLTAGLAGKLPIRAAAPADVSTVALQDPAPVDIAFAGSDPIDQPLEPASTPIDPSVVDPPSEAFADPVSAPTSEPRPKPTPPVADAIQPIEPTAVVRPVAEVPDAEAAVAAPKEVTKPGEKQAAPPIEEPLPAVAVWTPFYSEASAQGFANRLTGAIEVPFAVRKLAAAEYLVTYQPETAQDWFRVRDEIATIFGTPDAP